MDRRELLGLGTAVFAGLAARAAADNAIAVPSDEPTEIMPLWPGVPPGKIVPNLTPVASDSAPAGAAFHDRFLSHISTPYLIVFRPEKPDGSALMIVPGGGYSRLNIDNEGYEVATRFAAQDVTSFVLVYRLPDEGWSGRQDVPLADAQRAMRLIRSNVARFGLDPARIGVLGFSAGGHLAACLAARSDAALTAPVDAADALDAHPSATMLLYPVITMLKPFAHEASREKLLGANASAALRAAYSCELLVRHGAAPTFLAAALDDPDVPVDNTLAMFASLRARKIASEMHLFEHGGHGFGIRGSLGQPTGVWPDLVMAWGRAHKIFSA